MEIVHVSGPEVSHVLGSFGTGDIQTTHGSVWILTNGECENTGHWDTAVFSYYGSDYQEGDHDSQSYPLTLQESQFLQPGGLDLPEYATEMLLGYSAWWQNRKWFCPILEYCYEPEGSADKHHGLQLQEMDLLAQKDGLRVFVESEAERLAALLFPLDGVVLLDLDSLPDRYSIHLFVPCERVLARFQACDEWYQLLRFWFSITQDPVLVYIDTNCEQEHGGNPEVSNSSGKSYGCAVYELTHAPHFSPDDFDSLHDWLRNEAEPLLKAWGPSEEAAVHNARLLCHEQNYVPVDPYTHAYLPRKLHML